MKILFSIMVVLLSLSSISRATPGQIVIVRHGEKIDETDPGLSPEGCERAYQLPQFFHAYQSNVVAIYAQQAPKAHSSIRPLETIAPTAKGLNLKINNSFLRDDVQQLAREILNTPAYTGKTLFISWEHSAIIDLVGALGIKLSGRLQKWPGSVFDQAWVITFISGQPQLSIVAEMALPTDVLPAQSGIENWGSNLSQINNGVIVPAGVISECKNGNSLLNQIVKEHVTNSVPGL